MSPSADRLQLSNQFLIAMPGMQDPTFARTLTYICEHGEHGAIGLIVNRPIDFTLADMFDQIGIELTDPNLRAQPVHFGGPVFKDRGFVLHQPLGNWHSTLRIDDETGLTTSRDVLDAIARGEGPTRLLVALGYAGWSGGQVEDEMARNGWLSVAAPKDLIFDLPAEARLSAAMGQLGFDWSNLSDSAGHA